MGVVVKHQFLTVPMVEVFFSDICLQVVMTKSFLIFIILYWEKLLKVINEIQQSYFLYIAFFHC